MLPPLTTATDRPRTCMPWASFMVCKPARPIFARESRSGGKRDDGGECVKALHLDSLHFIQKGCGTGTYNRMARRLAVALRAKIHCSWSHSKGGWGDRSIT